MKKVASATAVLALLISSAASAADLPVAPAVSYVKPAPAALLYNWGGFYVGANGGWGTSHKCWDFAGTVAAPIAAPLSEGCHDADGGTLGGQFGYRWQYTYIILGLEGQGNWANFKGSNVSQVFPAFSNQTNVDAFGFLTGQVGYAWDNILLYVKGGAAAVHDKYSFGPTATGIVTGSASETRWGGSSVSVLSSVLRRTGRLQLNTTMRSWAHAILPSTRLPRSSPSSTFIKIWMW